MKLERVEDLLREFSSKRVLVIGDLMLDEFVWGRVSRISPEAPVRSNGRRSDKRTTFA